MLLVVTGPERQLADAVAAHVARRGEAARPVARIDEPHRALDRAALFHALVDHPGRILALIEGLRRPGTDAPPPWPIEPAIRAALGAGVGRFVVVTSRADGDPELVRLRRSGLPYAIVRAPCAIGLAAPADALAGRRVYVSRAAVDRAAGAVLLPDVIDAAARALDERDWIGRTVELGPPADAPPAVALLERAGARPVVVGPGRLRAVKWLGRPTAALDERGDLAVAWQPHHARPAAPLEPLATVEPQ